MLPTLTEARDVAVAALCAPELASIIAVVTWPIRDDSGRPTSVMVANHEGVAELSEQSPDGVVLSGRHPLPSTDPMAFLPYEAERSNPSPEHGDNSYPLPWLRLSSFFSDRRSPDIAIVHTAGHYFPDENGHHGEHGSLDVIQSRAP